MTSVASDLRWNIKWPAPAKLNLMLRIVGRREDGYHLLQTVFQFIDLCDWVHFVPRNDGLVTLRKEIEGVSADMDLTVRAAQALKQYTGCQLGVEIDVEKNIPMGGGLGGGSSDAATTLVVLNRLWRLGLSKKQLMDIGLRLGADVPVFVHGSAAWAEGIGEELVDIEPEEQWVVVIKPECHVNTKQIFCSKELTRDSKRITISDFIAGDKENDCLAVVKKLYKPVEEALEDLSFYTFGRLTGTGACVFGEFDSQVKASDAASGLKKKWNVFLVKGLNNSPLYSVLEQ